MGSRSKKLEKINNNFEEEIKMTVPFKVDLTDKVAVVTGGGGVLGSYFAKALAECGAKVAIMDLNQEPADKVAA